jgi:hypothetical protein
MFFHIKYNFIYFRFFYDKILILIHLILIYLFNLLSQANQNK